MSYKVVEIFESVQGEGHWLGTACLFIRFAGCNLTCPWCDTKNSWGNVGTDMTIEELTSAINLYVIRYRFPPLVVLTGGEPLMQHNLRGLCKRIHSQTNSKIAIETNGTLPMSESLRNEVDWVTVSPKPQSNFAVHHTLRVNELKYVVDEEFSTDVITTKNIPIWFQPEGNNMAESWERCYEIVTKAKNPNWRVGVQLHKIMEVQ